MKYRPQLLKSVPYPDCMNSCSHPAACHLYCQDKMRDDNMSKYFMIGILTAVSFLCGMFLLVMSFKA